MSADAMKPADAEIQPQHALWLLCAISRAHQKTVNEVALARECVPPISIDAFTQLAERVGFQVCQLGFKEQSSASLPFAVELQCSAGAATDASPPARSWVIVVHREADDVRILEFGAVSRVITNTELAGMATGIAFSFAPLPEPLNDPDASDSHSPRFGFGWFVPELLKHKKLWREVLLASLVLQLIALAFPLFTQAIIDKVVAHRTQSTLVALSIGMAVFIIFTVVLTWIRQYLILHTGNRVDAVLRSHVFEHLFRLPPLYFQRRPMGVIAARLQGIETIREFVSSAAIAIMLDLPFLLIFVAIMFWYSVKLTLIVLVVLAMIVCASLLVAPLFQRRLNEQFLRGAANQAFLTEYVAGLETVKSLQLEPQLNRR